MWLTEEGLDVFWASPVCSVYILCHWDSVKCVQTQCFFWSVYSRIQSECGKIQTRKNSVFEYFSRSLENGDISCPTIFPLFDSANTYLFKFSFRNSGKSCEIYWKSTIKTPDWCHWRCSGVKLEHMSHLFLIFLFLTLNLGVLINAFIR